MRPIYEGYRGALSREILQRRSSAVSLRKSRRRIGRFATRKDRRIGHDGASALTCVNARVGRRCSPSKRRALQLHNSGATAWRGQQRHVIKNVALKSRVCHMPNGKISWQKKFCPESLRPPDPHEAVRELEAILRPCKGSSSADTHGIRFSVQRCVDRWFRGIATTSASHPAPSSLWSKISAKLRNTAQHQTTPQLGESNGTERSRETRPILLPPFATSSSSFSF